MRLLPLLLLSSIAWAEPPHGGGPLPQPADEEMSAAQRARIDAMLQRNVAELERAGQLAAVSPWTPLQGGLQWPLRAAAGFADPGFHGISNFVDLNPAAGQLLDWSCGARTYDGHAGIDIFLTPFSWLMMDQGAVDIVAAAPGTIIGKTDGNDDRSCPDHYSADWNAVYVQHADGSVAWYGHMKKFSQTAKPVGAAVATGEFLGKVGSSGFSTGPHLHFENHSAVSGYAILEPYQGGCNTSASLWAQQRPYNDSAINKIAVHDAEPDFHGENCPDPVDETPHTSDHYQPGQLGYFAAYYRDQLGPQATTYAILRPDGSVQETWVSKPYDFFPGRDYYASSYWYWGKTIPVDAPFGAWRWSATYEGVTYTHDFFVGDVIFANGFD
ncbi:peptidoglycan DD-metalloendopeptidase family protein [Dokdonella sp.]|uniref:peptidoglycan DD-metalloendopeptidase family protein n=1 Tax=Dokdonella sp. TaxID=2291710 RepID=UPI001B04B39D|nr:peptidoglycan DD-metalloendopeptidase family protein [Dokdonella sp.]MBO9663181.1 peptidoglycan DD-metalloendopeptidase family protein [Dokdonella sp.]